MPIAQTRTKSVSLTNYNKRSSDRTTLNKETCTSRIKVGSFVEDEAVFPEIQVASLATANSNDNVGSPVDKNSADSLTAYSDAVEATAAADSEARTPKANSPKTATLSTKIAAEANEKTATAHSAPITIADTIADACITNTGTPKESINNNTPNGTPKTRSSSLPKNVFMLGPLYHCGARQHSFTIMVTGPLRFQIMLTDPMLLVKKIVTMEPQRLAVLMQLVGSLLVTTA